MLEIVLASSNAGKIVEFNNLFHDTSIRLIEQSALNIHDADETGQTFVENAIIKARHATKISNLPAIADDSGLIVQHLNGSPGVHSARYAGEQRNWEENIHKLLQTLQDNPASERNAEFHCVLCVMRNANDPAPLICHGVWSGKIALEPRGSGGFGYDPVFLVADHNMTAAELPLETKNTISHRAKAMQQLKKNLFQFLECPL